MKWGYLSFHGLYIFKKNKMGGGVDDWISVMIMTMLKLLHHLYLSKLPIWNRNHAFNVNHPKSILYLQLQNTDTIIMFKFYFHCVQDFRCFVFKRKFWRKNRSISSQFPKCLQDPKHCVIQSVKTRASFLTHKLYLHQFIEKLINTIPNQSWYNRFDQISLITMY